MPPSCKDGTVEIISFHTVLFICKNFVNINEIAETCGFDDHAYFCRVFKKETGLAPNEFQLRLLENNKIYPLSESK